MSEIRQDEDGVLWSDYTLEYAYKRSLGPVIGRCLTDLRDGIITGAKTSADKVMFPPTEYDPDTSEPIGDFVQLAETGEVTTWAWVQNPREKHPLDEPFAWALIQLDGADVPFLHAVRAESEDALKAGLKVKAVWRDDRVGSVLDIHYFEPIG